ncbi:gamma-interferon-responsive lysosomal thiol protein-like [Telopea speciosissima]|uniref:gamma-interferon-responsive lysosomal thiol protein-like n=1 Tax=Telopea speciosissima TaxID=54955 RepID=UPI001CC3784E|nr:gamma-interferon-responsive lysosomal thiol protein-like [Telopea speciosissima]
MASLRFHSLLLLPSYIFVFASTRVCSSPAPKVSLALYYETLCPYCSRFIVNQLAKVFEKELITIVDLKLVPYGNARIEDQDHIVCQHGPMECLLNTVEACAIDVWPDLNEHFKFIYCVEHMVLEGKYKGWQSCFEKMNLNKKPIEECYNSGRGKEIELKYAKITDSLNHPHKYVPWVTVNDQPLYEDYENFIAYVCKAYTGNPLPEACKSLTHQIVSVEKANSTSEVCFADETTKTSASYSSSLTKTGRTLTAGTPWRRRMM